MNCKVVDAFGGFHYGFDDRWVGKPTSNCTFKSGCQSGSAPKYSNRGTLAIFFFEDLFTST